MHKYITDSTDGPTPEVRQSLDELARDGARRMIEAALQWEVEEYLARLRGELDEQGHALAVRNGRARERKLTLGAGTVTIRAPRVHDRRPGQSFTSKILPPYMRRSPAVDEALPALYLRGLSTGDFSEGLAALVGPEGAALSAATITRLLQSCRATSGCQGIHRLEAALVGGDGLCICLGGRLVLQCAPRGGSSGLPGAHWGAHRW